jgi:hypothetical protein
MSDNKPMISDEAVEAAHKAWRAQAATEETIFEYNLRAALEAAAPFIAAEAWEDGQYAIWGYLANRSNRPRPTNPYRSQQ